MYLCVEELHLDKTIRLFTYLFTDSPQYLYTSTCSKCQALFYAVSRTVSHDWTLLGASWTDSKRTSGRGATTTAKLDEGLVRGRRTPTG